MAEKATTFLDFLEGIYGRQAVDQMARLSGMDREDLNKASDAFLPAFLKSLLDVRTQSHATQSATDMPSFANFWPDEMKEVMSTFMNQSAVAAKQFSPDGKEEAVGFPFNIFAEQAGTMEKLHQVFMGQLAQSQLIDEVSRKTGLGAEQLKTLYPMLTTYGLMPLMPQMMPPSMDDPAGWVDYLGEMGRRNFRDANREFDAMPSPMNAAFGGLLAGLFPSQSEGSQPDAPEPDKAQAVRDASLELQANYIKGLNGLFESYQKGLNKGD